MLEHSDQLIHIIRHLTNLCTLDLLFTSLDSLQLSDPCSQPQAKASGVTTLKISSISAAELFGKPELGLIDLLKVAYLEIHVVGPNTSDLNGLISAATSLEKLKIKAGCCVGL